MDRQTDPTPAGRTTPIHGRIGRQNQLSTKIVVKIAWQNLSVRLVRSLLVTSGIILALAFLTYILCSDALQNHIAHFGPPKLVEELTRTGILVVTDADAVIQTRWMVVIALLVTFVGILNAMLLSVTERFREIGTMKCLGALDRLIVQLFLLESTFQGIVGTTVGVAVGVVFVLVEGAKVYGAAMWGLLPWALFAGRMGLCLVAGTVLTMVGALYPAYVAARMQPVDAMRMEV